MTEYLLRLLLLVPLVGGMAWGSLWLWKRVQLGLPSQAPRDRPVRPVRLVDVLTLGTAGRLAVVEFGGRTLLIATSRQGISLIADDAAQIGDFLDV